MEGWLSMLAASRKALLLSLSRVQAPAQHVSVRPACHMSKKKRARLREMDRDMSWTEPLLEYRAEKEARTTPPEPHMLHVVWRARALQGRPWWEKDIMHNLRLDGKKSTPVVHKNIPAVNKLLTEIKHLVVIKPLTFPHGMPEHESDFEHMYIKPNGEAIVKKRLEVLGPPESDQEAAKVREKWNLNLDDIRNYCDGIRLSHRIHTEYHRAKYTYRKNQDGKEFRYNFNKNVRPYQY